MSIDRHAEYLDQAAFEGRLVEPITDSAPDFGLEEAYLVQQASMKRRAERGDPIIGMKMGLTSRAKMEQMNVREPIFGCLTKSMLFAHGDPIPTERFVQPRIEPEIAFLLKEPLRGPTTSLLALRSVEAVCVALEIIDSRYRDFRFTLPDVVADNASSAGFLLGEVMLSGQTEVANLGIILRKNGQIVETASSASILDHPARSLATLANMLADRGEHLKAGMIVLAGAATKAIHVAPGDFVEAQVQSLGKMEARFI